MLIAVGSLNPAKIEAVRLGYQAYFPDIACAILGTAAPSGVSDQPMSAEESLTGARNRAAQAMLLAPEATYGVGLEGGMHHVEDQWFDTGWIVVRNREGREGIGSTVSIPLSQEAVRMVLEEKLELGDAIDRIYGTVNIKQAQGHFGLMTGNRITRATGYRDAVIIALSHLEDVYAKL